MIAPESALSSAEKVVRFGGRKRSQTASHFLAALPFYAAPYDSLTHLLGANLHQTSQTLPVTALLAPLYLLMRLPNKLRIDFKQTENYLPLLIFLFISIVTLVNIFIESNFSIDADLVYRNATASRQALSMLLGIATYYMFVDATARLPIEKISKALLIGAIPTAALTVYQFASGEFRLQGFSSEPSHLADFIVWAVLPACIALPSKKNTKLAFAAIAIATLLLTYSSTGYLKGLCIALLFVAARGVLLPGLMLIFGIVSVTFILLSMQPENYVFLIVGSMYQLHQDSGDIFTSNGSFVDRFFGFIGPLSLLGESHAWLGFGFGGDSVYFKRMFDPSVIEIILSVKGDTPSIASLQGKMLMYGGAIGYLLYLSIWFTAWSKAKKQHVSRIVLPAIFLGSLFSLGPIFLPYIWMWLAIAVNSTKFINTDTDSYSQ